MKQAMRVFALRALGRGDGIACRMGLLRPWVRLTGPALTRLMRVARSGPTS